MKMKIAKSAVILGVLLVLIASGVLIFNLLITSSEQQDTAKMLQQIDAILPESSVGTLSDSQMPVLEIEGQDIVAVLEIPKFSLSLPVGSTWDAKKVSAYPRCFSGSAYDRTMVIGGSDHEAQLDCLTVVDIGDEVTITDMTGAVFTYEVQRVDRCNSADETALTDADSHLTLFVRDTYSLQYIIVRCTAN